MDILLRVARIMDCLGLERGSQAQAAAALSLYLMTLQVGSKALQGVVHAGSRGQVQPCSRPCMGRCSGVAWLFADVAEGACVQLMRVSALQATLMLAILVPVLEHMATD